MADNKAQGVEDTKDAILEAQAEVMEIVREIMQEAMMPQVIAQAKQLWRTLPDEMKEQFKQERPNEYAELMKGQQK